MMYTTRTLERRHTFEASVERLEKRVAQRTEFPIYMTPAFVSIFLAMTAVLMYPPASSLAIAGFLHLNVISYGIVNDMLAVRDSIDYFRFGHQPGQLDSVTIPSTKKNVQAFHWGVLATWALSALGAGIIAFVASRAAPVTPFIYPLISMVVAGVLFGAHRYSKAPINPNDLWMPIETIAPGDTSGRANWYRCSNRNSFGYMVLPLAGVGLAIGIGTSAVNSLAGVLPAVLSGLASPVMPLVLAVPQMFFIGGMFINYLEHRNTIEPDQTLPRKFGINPNFMNDNDLESEAVQLTPDLDPERTAPLEAAVQEDRGASFTPLQQLHNARADDTQVETNCIDPAALRGAEPQAPRVNLGA